LLLRDPPAFRPLENHLAAAAEIGKVRRSMDERLSELIAQRALIRKHLDWLDKEIAGAQAPVPATPDPATPPPETPRGTLPVYAPPAMDLAPSLAEAEAFLPPDPVAIRQDVRRGCWIWFAISMLALAGGIALIFVLF
jgi:hypothetical protein